MGFENLGELEKVLIFKMLLFFVRYWSNRQIDFKNYLNITPANKFK